MVNHLSVRTCYAKTPQLTGLLPEKDGVGRLVRPERHRIGIHTFIIGYVLDSYDHLDRSVSRGVIRPLFVKFSDRNRPPVGVLGHWNVWVCA